MPRCGVCGKNYDNPAEIELLRNQEDRWIPVCRACVEQNVDVNRISYTNNLAVENFAIGGEEALQPSIEAPLSSDPMENVRKLLTLLKKLRYSKERIGRARTSPRKPVELTVFYTFARDDARYEAKVLDFSQSGIHIITGLSLSKGQLLQFDWNIPLPASMAKVLHNSGEVRRVTRLNDNKYDVGIRFLDRQGDKGVNRRRFHRYKCDMDVFYQPPGSSIMAMGKVIDISQGGCQMRLDEKLEFSDLLQVKLVGGAGSRGDLVGNLKVCRVISRDNIFETGCAFEKMRMESQTVR
ncbi:MAG: PilZ domain-containing protein [Planctomycetota bacterium]|jgi:hypothetical protein|nr:PilZ domain-containing protein [Planctomycetota bacterium]